MIRRPQRSTLDRSSAASDVYKRQTVVRITRQRYDTLTAQSHDFARWALQMAHGQLFFFEMKNSVINGDAKERFLSLVKNRPEIMEKVPLKFVASYLGITQSYLSRLKKAVMKP